MGTEAITVERRQGRLLEIRPTGSPGADVVGPLRERMKTLEAGLEGDWLTVVDLRHVSLFGDETARGFIELMVRANPRTERAAYLLGDQGLVAIQIEALILAARSPDRWVFRERAALEAWLGEVATPEEKARLRAFLDEG